MVPNHLIVKLFVQALLSPGLPLVSQKDQINCHVLYETFVHSFNCYLPEHTLFAKLSPKLCGILERTWFPESG